MIEKDTERAISEQSVRKPRKPSKRRRDETGDPSMRRKTRAKDTSGQDSAPDDMEELAHGQIVIVSARWVLVLAGLLLTLWDPGAIGSLRIEILLILLMAVANFYLHAQALMRRPILPQIIYAASAGDLAIVTIFVIMAGGFSSNLYTFYFPAVLAFSVVFPTAITFLYIASTAALYTLISLGSFVVTGVGYSMAENDLQVLVTRLLVLAAIAVCGNIYWRIERDRRLAATEAREELVAEIDRRASEDDLEPGRYPPVYERS